MRIQLAFLFFTFFHSFSNAQFIDMESWGLVELVQYDSDLFQFRHRDSTVKQIKLVDKQFGDKFIWNYDSGRLIMYSQKSRMHGRIKVDVFGGKTRVDSLVKKQDYWVDLIFYQYDSLGMLCKVEASGMLLKSYKKRPAFITREYSMDVKIHDEMMLVFDTVTTPRYIDTIAVADILKSYSLRKSVIKDSLSFDGITKYRKHFGCVFTQSDYWNAHLQKSMRVCPDSLLWTEISHYNALDRLSSIDVISENPNQEYYTLFFRYNTKGYLSTINSNYKGKEKELYEFTYKY